MQHERAKTPHPTQERAPWTQPVLFRLKGGSAEFETGPNDDGPDVS